MLSSPFRSSAVIVHSAKRWISYRNSYDNKCESMTSSKVESVLKNKEKIKIVQRKSGWSQELGNVDDLSNSINIFVKPKESKNKEVKSNESLQVDSKCCLPCNSHDKTFPSCENTTQQWHNQSLPISKNGIDSKKSNANPISYTKHFEQKMCNGQNDQNECNDKSVETRAEEFEVKVNELSNNKEQLKQPSSLPKRTSLINARLTPTTSFSQSTKFVEGVNKHKGERIHRFHNEDLQQKYYQKEANNEHKSPRKLEENGNLLTHEANGKNKDNKCSNEPNNEISRGVINNDDNNDINNNNDDDKNKINGDDSRYLYYRNISNNQISKEEMWRRIRLAKSDKTEKMTRPLEPDDVDYLKIVTDLKEHDLFHFRVGEMAYEDKLTRRDYYGMWALAMSLNKARWSMMQAHAERGMKTTGAGIKLLYWKESIAGIVDKGCMVEGQFSDQHPVLRIFGDAIGRHPKMTKAFIRGFTDARLRVLQQPGNVKQLFDYYDKFYGYFFNSLLQVVGIKDEGAEHLMLHIGRALGLTLHTVMLWKKYARIGFTMLPADLCADHRVNMALLRNIPLASLDLGVRELLHEVMCIVKNEMKSAESIAKDVTPLAWPIVMECTYPNYHLMWLQRQHFNVSALLADYNVENPGLTWYRLKKQWEWKRHQSVEKLVAEAAPLPFIGTS